MRTLLLCQQRETTGMRKDVLLLAESFRMTRRPHRLLKQHARAAVLDTAALNRARAAALEHVPLCALHDGLCHRL